MPLHKALFVEPSPTPVKFGASVLGLVENRLRLPMLPATPQTEAALRALLYLILSMPEYQLA